MLPIAAILLSSIVANDIERLFDQVHRAITTANPSFGGDIDAVVY